MNPTSDRREFLKLAAAAPLFATGGIERENSQRFDPQGTPLSREINRLSWPQQRYDAANTGETVERGPNPEPKLYDKWRTSRVDTHPSVADGRVFAGRSGDLVALDLSDGRELWRKSTSAKATVQPAVADGLVVVRTERPNSGRHTANEYGPIEAFGAKDGTKQWSYSKSAGEKEELTPVSSPTISNGTVYTTAVESGSTNTSLGTKQTISALDLQDGTERWRRMYGLTSFRPGYTLSVTPKPAIVDGSAYLLGTQSHKKKGWARVLAYSFDASSGEREWKRTIETGRSPTISSRSPAVADGIVWFNLGSMGTRVGDDVPTVYAFDAADGRLLQTISRQQVYGHTPTLANGLVFLFGNTSPRREKLWAFDAQTGEEVWDKTIGPVSDYGTTVPGKGQGNAPFIVRSPIVSGNTVYVISDYGVVHAFDIEYGTEQWTYAPGQLAVQTIPTVLEDNLLVQGRDEEKGELSLFDVWDGGLKVSLPTEATALSGLTNTVELELHNQLPTSTTGISYEVTAQSEAIRNVHVEDPIGTLPPASSPDAEASVTISFDVAPAPDSLGGPHFLEVEVNADGGRGGGDAGQVVVEPTLQMSVDLPSQGLPLEAGESVGTFEFDVTCNDEQAMEDVELIPRFAGVAGEWETIDVEGVWKIRFDSAYIVDGGRWQELENYDDKRWRIDELDTEASRKPGLRLAVPEGIAKKDKPRMKVHDLQVDGYVRGEDGTRRLVNTVYASIPVYERRLKIDSVGPAQRQFANDEFGHEVYVSVEDDPVENLRVRVELPESEDGTGFGFLPDHDGTAATTYGTETSASHPGTFTDEGGFAVWETSETVEPGTTFALDFRLRAPSDPDKAKHELTAAVEGEVAGGRRLDPNEDTAVVRISRSDILFESKEELSQVIDRNTVVPDPILNDSQLVEKFAKPVKNHAYDTENGKKQRTNFAPTAAKTLERMLDGELVTNRTIELLGPAPRDGDMYLGATTDLNLAEVYTEGVFSYVKGLLISEKVVGSMFSNLNPVKEDLLSAGVGLVFGLVKRGIGLITRSWIGTSWSTLGRIASTRFDVATHETIDRRAKSVASAMFEGVEPKLEEVMNRGIMEVLSNVVAFGWEIGYSGMNGVSFSPFNVVTDTNHLMKGLQYAEVKGGVRGSQQKASQAGSISLKYFEGVAKSLKRLIAIWSESLLENVRQLFRKLFKAVRSVLDQDYEANAVYNAVGAVYDAVQAAIGVFQGHVPKIVLSVSTLSAVNRIRRDTINALIAGTRPAFTGFTWAKWKHTRGRASPSPNVDGGMTE